MERWSANALSPTPWVWEMVRHAAAGEDIATATVDRGGW